MIMDELQNWFGSNQSRNFPPEMLGVITQNRKNRRVILGTAQNFYLLAKAIRSQCTEIRQCVTLAGVLTIVIKREPIIDNDGDVKDLKYRGMYFFVHSERLRNSYDTWSVVDALSSSGFQEVSNSGDRDVIIKVQQQPKKKKKNRRRIFRAARGAVSGGGFLPGSTACNTWSQKPLYYIAQSLINTGKSYD